MTLYSNFFSSAINSVEINEKVVKITYSSNLEKHMNINVKISQNLVILFAQY